MYTLVKSSDGFPNRFEVVADNIKGFWNPRMSITWAVYVFLDFGEDGFYVSVYSPVSGQLELTLRKVFENPTPGEI